MCLNHDLKMCTARVKTFTIVEIGNLRQHKASHRPETAQTIRALSAGVSRRDVVVDVSIRRLQNMLWGESESDQIFLF